MNEEVMPCFPINIIDNGNGSQQTSDRLVSMVLRPNQSLRNLGLIFK